MDGKRHSFCSIDKTGRRHPIDSGRNSWIAGAMLCDFRRLSLMGKVRFAGQRAVGVKDQRAP